MSRKEVSMIGNLTRDMMRDVMETSLKKADPDRRIPKESGGTGMAVPE